MSIQKEKPPALGKRLNNVYVDKSFIAFITASVYIFLNLSMSSGICIITLMFCFLSSFLFLLFFAFTISLFFRKLFRYQIQLIVHIQAVRIEYLKTSYQIFPLILLQQLNFHIAYILNYLTFQLLSSCCSLHHQSP